MTFQDWLTESANRYQTKPITAATKESARAFVRGGFRHVGGHIGSPVWGKGDWDVLVVLDACRADLWDEVAPEYGLETGATTYSNASCSIDWILRNFNACPEDAASAGYVTANPFADHDTPTARSANLSERELGHFRPLYKTHWEDLFGGQIATVPPETVTDHAISAWRERNSLGIERLVVHYMQPHEPYRARPEWGSGDSKLLENLVDPDQPAGASVWPVLQEGGIEMDEFWEVYKDNLRWALDDVTERLLPNVGGDVVISADHGNALGEWGEWHHPPGAIGPAVRRVPWVPIECEDGHTVDPDVSAGDAASPDVNEQLAALGYKGD